MARKFFKRARVPEQPTATAASAPYSSCSSCPSWLSGFDFAFIYRTARSLGEKIKDIADRRGADPVHLRVPAALAGNCHEMLVVLQPDKSGFSWSVSVQGKARLAVNGRSPLQ